MRVDESEKNCYFSDVFKGVCIHFRWDDDVVFKNCAKDDDKPKVMRHIRGLCVFKSKKGKGKHNLVRTCEGYVVWQSRNLR